MTGKTKEEIIALIKANESKGMKKYRCGKEAADKARVARELKRRNSGNAK